MRFKGPSVRWFFAYGAGGGAFCGIIPSEPASVMDDVFASQSLEGGFQGFLADSTMGGSLWVLGCTLTPVSSPCGLRIVLLCQGEHRGVRLGRRRLRLSRGALPCPIRREVRPDIPLLVGSPSGYSRCEGVTWGCPRSPPSRLGL